MSNLDMQREILAANGNPFELAEIARRHGINPALWWYFHDSMEAVRRITEHSLTELAALIESPEQSS